MLHGTSLRTHLRCSLGSPCTDGQWWLHANAPANACHFQPTLLIWACIMWEVKPGRLVGAGQLFILFGMMREVGQWQQLEEVR